MNTELDALLALGQSRRAAGLPCNPRREGVADIDWLDELQIQKLHKLGLQIELEKVLADRCEVKA